MSEYGSKYTLLHTCQQRDQENNKLQNMVSPKKSDFKKEGATEYKSYGCQICVLVVVFLSFVFVITLICIGAVYIQHLLDRLDIVEQRVRSLERVAKEGSFKYSVEDGTDEVNRVIKRMKRAEKENPDHHGDEHEINEHHGIPNHHIALLYGDPRKLRDAGNTDPKYDFTINRTSPDARHCKVLYIRGDEQLLCRPVHNTKPWLYSTSRENHTYGYFAQASWMDSNKTKQNFEVLVDGTIAIQTTGLYIVHASIHFGDVTMNDYPYISVYKSDGNGGNETLISKCLAVVNQHTRVYPCQAWQLASLNEGELIYLKIGAHTWFRVEKETFHLALIRLNYYPHDIYPQTS